MTNQAREHLLAALAAVGVEADDYALIEQARALVDEANARISARGSNMIYSVTLFAGSGLLHADQANASQEAVAEFAGAHDHDC